MTTICSHCATGQHPHDADARTGRDAGCPVGPTQGPACACTVDAGVMHVRSPDCTCPQCPGRRSHLPTDVTRLITPEEHA